MLQVFLPLKNTAVAKSRLADVLSDDQRVALVTAMALDVVDAILGGAGSARLTVVAPAHWQSVLPRSSRLTILDESGFPAGGLNALLHGAVELVRPEHALVVHGDLPFLRPEDIDTVQRRLQGRDLVLCPDAARYGTNALAFRAASTPLFQFGQDSFAAHRRFAESRRYRWGLVAGHGFACDIDTPADLVLLLNHVAAGKPVGPATAQWAERHGHAVAESLPRQYRSPESADRVEQRAGIAL